MERLRRKTETVAELRLECRVDAVALALYDDESALMDVALILALVGFLGTVAFARYVEIRGWPGKKS